MKAKHTDIGRHFIDAINAIGAIGATLAIGVLALGLMAPTANRSY